MNDAKYMGLDVRQATISAAVLDSAGKLLMESTFETKAATILQFLDGLPEMPALPEGQFPTLGKKRTKLSSA